MSTTINEAFINAYDDNVDHLAQQNIFISILRRLQNKEKLEEEVYKT